jgi:hypothetical protein
MRKAGLWRGALLGLALGLVIALGFWPSTGWLVRSQMRLLIPTTPVTAAWSPVEIDRPTTALIRAKADFDDEATKEGSSHRAKLAAILLTCSPQASMNDDGFRLQLRALAAGFPTEPEPRAAILRLSTLRQVRIDRPEIAWLLGETAPKSAEVDNSPEHMKEFDDDAAIGEQLDPGNAFFPFMRAVGQFTAGQDSAAFASLDRASKKHVWNDYVCNDLEAELDLYRKTFGEVSGLPRRAITAAIILPHLSQIQATARLASALAAKMELRGQTSEGLAIRLRVLRCGALIRAQSTQMIGNLVGRLLAYAATTRPGGALPAIRPAAISAEVWNNQRLEAFRGYLRSIGHAEAIPVFERELHSGDLLHSIAVQLKQVDFEEAVWKSGLGWLAGIWFLSAAIWLAIIGLLCATAGQIPKSGENPNPVQAFLYAATIPFTGLLLYRMITWQLIGSTSAVTHLTWGFLAEGRPGLSRMVSAVTVGTAIVVPLFFLLTMVFVALWRRVPIGVFVADVAKRWATPTIAVLVVGYSFCALFTVRQEAALNQAIDQIVKHEGRFLSEGIGASWPK